MTLTGCGFHGLYGTHLPGGADVGSHPYSVTIYFSDVLDLVPQSAVKVNDVAVGRVDSVALSSAHDTTGDARTNGWTAKVTITVNSDVQLPDNARAMIKQTSLLGEKYVDLEQPLDKASSTDLKTGDTIPITRTGSAPEVEEVLGALSLLLNGGGLQQIKVITTELNKALNGQRGSSARPGQPAQHVRRHARQPEAADLYRARQRQPARPDAQRQQAEDRGRAGHLPAGARDPEERPVEADHDAHQPGQSRDGGDRRDQQDADRTSSAR